MAEGSARISEEHDRAEHASHAAEQSGAEQEGLPASQPAPTYPGKLLGDPRLKGRGNAPVQAALLQRMQQTHGNRATQRLLQRQRTGRSDSTSAAGGLGARSSPAPIQQQAIREEPLDSPQERPLAAPLTAPTAPAPPPPGGGAIDDRVSVQTAREPLASLTLQRADDTQGQPPSNQSPTVPAPASEWIVEDSVESLQLGQMTKSAFLAQVRSAVKAAVNQTMPGDTGASQAESQIDGLLRAYSNRDVRSLEQEIRNSVPGARSATTASAYIHLIAEHTRRTVVERSGAGGLLSMAAGNLVGGIGKLLFKGRDGDVTGGADPTAVSSQLGPGQPLDGEVKSGLEGAFGQSFSNVRIHTDTEAAGLSDNLNARAFTVGQNIAFGTGEYRPGTPIGDALIAHELAHVVQQGDAPPGGIQAKASGDYSNLEEDADIAAVRAVVGMRGGLLGGLARISQEAMPRLRSGLRLQRCGKDQGEASAEVSANIAKIASMIGMPDENADEIVSLLGEGDPTQVSEAVMADKTLTDFSHLYAIAGTKGGRRVLEAIRGILRRSRRATVDLEEKITEVLEKYKYEEDNPLVPAGDDKNDVDVINKVLKSSGEYASTEVDFFGRMIKIVPLQLPVVMLPSMPQMGGVYYTSEPSELKHGYAARTEAPHWDAGGKMQFPVVYIVINTRALFEMDNSNKSIDRTKPRTAAYLESILFHEFQHYKQFFARRGGEVEPTEPQAVDRAADREVEAFSLHIAHEIVSGNTSDAELKSFLETMAGFVVDSSGTFTADAEDRIVAAVKDNPDAQKRLIRLIDELTANESSKIKALKKAAAEGRYDLSKNPIEVMHNLAPLRSKLAALNPSSDSPPTKAEKRKSGRKRKR